MQLSINLSLDATVSMVYSVAEAVEYLQESLPDLIFVGLDNNELEALLELTAQPIVQAIPIVALANRVRLSDQQQIQQSGARAILTYPFEPIHLQTLLQDLGVVS